MTLVPAIMKLVRERGLDDILVLAGGIIPDEDIPELEEHGIEGVFGPGTITGEIIEYIKSKVAEKRAA